MKPTDLLAVAIAVSSAVTAVGQCTAKEEAMANVVEVARVLSHAGQTTAEAACEHAE